MTPEARADAAPPRLAFLSQDAVYVVSDGGEPRRLESAFAAGVRERARRAAQGQGWKTEKSGGFLSGGALWGVGDLPDPAAVRVAARGLGRGRVPGELVYCLDTGPVAGAFAYDLATGEEIRIFHGNQHGLEHLTAEPDGDLACSLLGPDGTSDIAVFGEDGATPRPVTSGDSLDQAPCFVPGRRVLMFQSAGVGRDRAGNPVGHGPFSLEQLDLESGELVTLAESPEFDFLAPRVAADGTLYSLRRPYRPPGHGSRLRALKDVLLFPFRVLRTFLGWLEWTSILYSGKRLTSAGGPRREGPELRQIVVFGNVIDAEKAARRARLRGDDAPALVPADWQLVRHDPAGEPQVLARHVLAFDLAGDGSVLVSNGSAVDRIGKDGSRERICRGASIEQVVALT